MSKEAFWGVIIAVALLFLGVVALWFSPNSMLRFRLPQRQKVSTQPQEQQIGQQQDAQEPLRITVTAKEYEFSPAEINAAVGQKVVITLKNEGTLKHNLVVRLATDTFDTKLIDQGESDTIEFVAATPGEFVYYCSVPGHRDRGMMGTLVVQ
jgi:plastocyanin